MIRVPPLAPGGCLFVGGGLWFLFRGLSGFNPYEIVLGAAALLVAAGLLAAGFPAARSLSSAAPVWTPPSPAAAGDGGEPHRLGGPDRRLPPFFRLHMRIRGRLELGGGRRIAVREDFRLEEDGTGDFRIRFPLSGVFHASGRLLVRDVFGLFAFNAGPEIHRSFPVLPAPHDGKPRLRIDAFAGTEDRQNRRSADEERYHMREYAPGDRYRDINWKTSNRLASLVTRISPFAQEKTRLVQVDFRRYGPASRPPLAALWTLDRAKARLLVFLRTLRDEHPEFVFRVRTADGEREIASPEELEAFAADLAGMTFAAAAAETASDAAAGGELFLFSTAYDAGLPAFLASRGDRPTRLYMTLPFRRGGESGPEPETLFARDLFRLGIPAGWGSDAGAALWDAVFRGGSGPRRPGHPAALASVPRPLRGAVDASYAETRP